MNILREDWKPVLNLNSVMVGLQYLFLEPNADDPLNKGELDLSCILTHIYVAMMCRGGGGAQAQPRAVRLQCEILYARWHNQRGEIRRRDQGPVSSSGYLISSSCATAFLPRCLRMVHFCARYIEYRDDGRLDVYYSVVTCIWNSAYMFAPCSLRYVIAVS